VEENPRRHHAGIINVDNEPGADVCSLTRQLKIAEKKNAA
jgi:hypothetical protein